MKPTMHSFKKFFSKRYRVVEVIKGDGKSTFFPQMRKFYSRWKPISKPDYPSTPSEYYSLEKADKFIYQLTMVERSETTVKKITHPFDAVFHKLKQQ